MHINLAKYYFLCVLSLALILPEEVLNDLALAHKKDFDYCSRHGTWTKNAKHFGKALLASLLALHTVINYLFLGHFVFFTNCPSVIGF